jgi:hypothetical protein
VVRLKVSRIVALGGWLLDVAANIGNLTRLRQDSLLTGRNLFFERGQTLFGWGTSFCSSVRRWV